jgi:aspartate/methionine/tyrosine aminotransferase
LQERHCGGEIRMTPPAPYLRWAKTRPRVTFDLASSGLLPVTAAELLGDALAKDAIQLSGPNDEGYLPLREAIGRRYGVPADCVSIAPGASGANFLAMLTLVGPGDEVLIERPAYDPLIAAARAAGATVSFFDRRRDDFAIDPDAMRAAITPATKLIVLSNAHNPSGALASRELLGQIGEIASRAGARVLVDEVYAEAQHDATPPPQTAALLGDTFIVTNSLTKAYGLAGLRCGWILAPRDVTRRVQITRDIVDGSGPFVAEHLAVTAFANLDRLRARARSILETNVARLRSMTEAHLRLEWIAPVAGTTAFPRVKGVDDTTIFVDKLVAEYDTVVVPGRFFQAPQHIRISFGGSPGMVGEALSRLDRALRDLK